MPFIWDNNNYRFIDEGEEYDYEHFVIVRKLFVELNETPCEFSEKLIWNLFEKYGQIESVEIINMAADGENNNAKALIDNVKASKNMFFVHPAKIWHQPPSYATVYNENNTKSSTSYSLQDLNEDCLLEIFKFCNIETLANLSEVCQSFKDILHRHRFPKIKKLSNNGMPLGTFCKILRCIGFFVVELDIYCWDWLYSDDNNKVSDKKHKLIQILNRYVGENIRKLNLYNIPLSVESVQPITAILNRLHTLGYIAIIKNNKDCKKFNKELDLRTLCPSLVKLKWASPSPLPASIQSWPTLIYLSIKHYAERMPAENKPFFKSFIKQNPHLKCLKFDLCDAMCLKQMVKYLPNLEKLTIYESDGAISADSLIHLSGLEQLEKLSLKFDGLNDLGGNEMSAILRCVSKLTELRKLKFQCSWESHPQMFDQIQHGIKILAQQLPHLESFVFSGYSLAESTVVDFVRFAESLKVFRIWDYACNTPALSITENAIKSIVSARKFNHSSSDKASLDAPLKLYAKQCSLNDSALHLLQDGQIQRYLEVVILLL